MSKIVFRKKIIFLILGLACVFWGPSFSLRAEEARVASSSLRIRRIPGQKKVEVILRLVDVPNITVASAGVASDPGVKVPVDWRSFDGAPLAHCAWMIVVDSSNPARKRTVEACVKETGILIDALPAGDAVLVGSLARDLTVMAPFNSSREATKASIVKIKADGDASLTTLIYQNLKQALGDHLANRPEVRKCLILFSDGKDESPGGPIAVKGWRDELIAAAVRLGVSLHTFGFAEKATEMNFFADLKEISIQTDGLHVPADVASKTLPADAWQRLVGVMHGGGTAVLDVSGLREIVPVFLDLKTASGRSARIQIPVEMISEALAADAPPGAPPSGEAVSSGIASGGTVSTGTESSGSTSAGTISSVNLGGTEESKTGAAGIEPPWWPFAGGGAVLVLAALLFARNARKKKEREARQLELDREVERARAARREALGSSSAPEPLAYLEMCDAAQTRYPITVKGVRIGRGKHNDVVIANDSVSGSHCVLSLRNNEWTIVDLKSGNGVIVNSQQVSQASLSPNDLIELGDIKMRFIGKG